MDSSFPHRLLGCGFLRRGFLHSTSVSRRVDDPGRVWTVLHHLIHGGPDDIDQPGDNALPILGREAIGSHLLGGFGNEFFNLLAHYLWCWFLAPLGPRQHRKPIV